VKAPPEQVAPEMPKLTVNELELSPQLATIRSPDEELELKVTGSVVADTVLGVAV